MQLHVHKQWHVLLEYSYSQGNIVLNMIKILFPQKFDIYFGFVYLFALSKHQSVWR